MDFFTAQDNARKTIRKLAFYFALAVLCVATLTYLVLSFIFRFPIGDPPGFLFFFVFPAILILLASLYKTIQLGSHGGNVAMDLGGQYLQPDTNNPKERQLLNVVEEMSIASGIPIPEVYILPRETGINAFSAGNTISEAAIGITQGAVDFLNRDELQGVIAHEFSHILHGDILINTRLIGMLYGVSITKILGIYLIHFPDFCQGTVNLRQILAFLLTNFILPIPGYILFAFGSIGAFFASMIKASISRQREYLADASAVQFTRNPDGIGNALRKIGGYRRGSRIDSPWAEEASHIYFAKHTFMASPNFPTHPPLKERINRIDPNWHGKFIRVESTTHLPDPATPSSIHSPLNTTNNADYNPNTQHSLSNFQSNLGTLTAANLALATRILFSLPTSLHQSSHHRQGSKAIILALLLSNDPKIRDIQKQAILTTLNDSIWEQINQFEAQANSIHSAAKIALIDLAISTIRKLPHANIFAFVQLLKEMVKADNQINLFEFMLQRMVRRHLEITLHKIPHPTLKYPFPKGLEPEIETLLSTLAYVGSDNPQQRLEAFAAGQLHIVNSLARPLHFQAIDNDTLTRVDHALLKLEHCSNHIKKMILLACARTVAADHFLSNQEAELIRAIGDGIGCPVPPLAYASLS